MKKIKKILLSLVLCVMVCASAITLFACTENIDKNSLYEQVGKVITKIDSEKTSNGMFVTRDVKGVSTDYALNYYATNATYSYYNDLFVIPMNYIVNYYEDLQRLEQIDGISGEGQTLVNDLSGATKAFSIAYEQCKENFNVYKNLSALYPQKVIEGALAIYKLSLKDLLKQVYNMANSLAGIKNVIFNDFAGLEQTNDLLDQTDSQTLRDYIVLQLAGDYYDALIVNLDMNDYTDKEANDNVSMFVDVNAGIKFGINYLYNLQAVSADKLKNFTGEAEVEQVTGQVISYKNTTVTEIISTMNVMNNERTMLNKALKSFNLAKFYENYSCSVDAYSASLPYAEYYYDEIKLYFGNYVQKYFSYLTDMFILGD